MSSNVFKTLFNLKFSDLEIETEFNVEKDQTIRNIYKVLLIIMIVLSYGNSIFVSYFISIWDSLSLIKCLIISSYISAFIITLGLILYIFNKKIVIFRLFNHIMYYLFFIIIHSSRFFINRILNSQNIWVFLVIIEFLIRIIWLSIGIHSYLEVLIILLLNLIIFWGLWIPMMPATIFNDIMFNSISYMVMLITFIGTSYLWEKQKRLIFYYRKQSDKKSIWWAGLFDNLNGGFLSIKSGKINFINKYLKKLVDQLYKENRKSFYNQVDRINVCNNSEVLQIIPDKSIFEKLHNQKIFLNEEPNETYEIPWIFSILFSNINTSKIENSSHISKLLEFSSKIRNYNNDRFDVYDELKKIISEIVDIQEFKLICDLNLKIEQTQYDLEFHCRYINKNDELDIILNDYTLTKTIQNKEAEFKYKTLFLSKIAHEIKNPLVSISELVDQSNDNFNLILDRNDEMINKNLDNLNEIKSLSDYLLVLIKDLNYFAESQINKDILILNKETNLQGIEKFCKNITSSLIRKANKTESVKFECLMEKNVPNIILSYEWRLKQILINLLSNSVKFTNYGLISLSISICTKKIDDPQIKFEVSDTGIGIQIEKQKKLYEPFGSITTKSNEMGSGLGLSVSEDIAKKLGSGLKFNSIYQNGTSFWFTIPLKIPILNDSNTNLNFKHSIVESNLNTTRIEDFALLKNFGSRYMNIINELYSQNDTLDNDQFNIIDHKLNKSPSKEINTLFEIYQSNNEIKIPIKAVLSNKGSCKRLIDFVCNNVSDLQEQLNRFENPTQDIINMIICDDEDLTRKSAARVIFKIFKEKYQNVNIIEARDGIESIFILYQSIMKGIKIMYIFSDENMMFLNGSKSIDIIDEMCKTKGIEVPKIILVTAYDKEMIGSNLSNSILKILPKPLKKDDIENFLNKNHLHI